MLGSGTGSFWADPVVARPALNAADSAADAAGHLQAIKERGELVVLCFPRQDGVFVRAMVEEHGQAGLHIFGGVDIDLLGEFARDLGVELRVVPAPIDELVSRLRNGEGDVIAGGFVMTRKRASMVEFSQAYISTTEVLVTRRQDGFQTLDDLKGKVGSVIGGSSHHEFLQSLEIPDIRVHTVSFALEQLLALSDGDADFAVLSMTSMDKLFAEYPEFAENLVMLHEFPGAIQAGFAFPPGSNAVEALNQFLDGAQGHRKIEAAFAKNRRPGAR